MLNMKLNIMSWQGDAIDLVIFGIIALFVCFCAYSIYGILRDRKKVLEEMEKEIDVIPPETYTATVLSKNTDIVYDGSVKMPVHRIAFYIEFQTVFKGNLRFEVLQEQFESINEKDKGTLFILDGAFVDFVKDTE